MTDPGRLRSLAERSEALILEHQAASGAFRASPTFPVYRFAWLRDDAFIADAINGAGQVARADRFLDWCAGVIEARLDRIDRLIRRHRAGDRIGPDEYLHQAGAPAESLQHVLDGRCAHRPTVAGEEDVVHAAADRPRPAATGRGPGNRAAAAR